MNKKMLPIIIGFFLIFLNFPALASVDNYPGFNMSTDKDSYSIDEDVQLELEKINTTIDSYYVDIFASKQLTQGTSDVFLVKSDILISDSKKIVSIDLDKVDGFISGGNANYAISVCSTNGCTMTTTNAITITLDTNLTISNIEASNTTNEAFTIKWQTNGSYDCTMIYSTKDGNLDDNLLVSTRDADDYIWGSNFPKTNSNGIYSYEIEVKNQGEDTKYFNGDKGYYNLICYDDNRNKVTSSVYSFDIPTNSKTNNPDDNSGSDDSNNTTSTDNSNTNQLVLQLQRQITALEKQVISLEKKLTILDQKFADKYKGTMFLDVENHGRLWYVDPASENRFYFENGEAALSISSKLATGITYEDIQKIPVGVPDKLYNLKDSDGDGLPDRLESALGSDPNKADTDGDGFSDKEELENGYDPAVDKKYGYNQDLINKLEGKMLLQVSGPNSHGEIWYIKDGRRWYGGTKDSMYEIMKARSLGATPDNIRKIAVGDVEGIE